MATSLIVTTADYQTGKTQQTTFTGVNPAATAAELQTFGEMTAALSKDTFVKATRVEQVDCAALLPIVPSSFTIDKNDGGSWSYPPIPADGVVSLPLSTVPKDNNRGVFRVYWTCDCYSAPLIPDIVDSDINNPFKFVSLGFDNRWTLTIRTDEAITAPRTVQFKFSVRGDDTYDDFVRNVTINITEG